MLFASSTIEMACNTTVIFLFAFLSNVNILTGLDFVTSVFGSKRPVIRSVTGI